MSDPLGYESLETCCGFLYDDDQMCLSSKRGCLGIRIKMSIFIFLRSCSVAHTGPEPPGSGDQVSGPKCWDFRYMPLCQTQRFTSPKLPLPPPHTHQYNVHPLKNQHQEVLGGSLLFCGWSPWLQTVPARVLLKLLEEELPLEVPQVLQDLRRQRLS